MRITVIDGQGGGVGKSLVTELKKELGDKIEIVVLGTNSQATLAMLKAGADVGATGENAIVVNASKADIITGPMGIIVSNSMMGELTPKMAEAIGSCRCEKILIPIQKCSILIAGNQKLPMQKLIEDAVLIIKNKVDNI